MGSVSKLTAGLMLGVAGLAMTAAPAFAQKAKREKAAPAPKMSKEFAAPAVAAQDLVKAGNFEGAKAKIAEAEPFAKTPDELFNLNVIRLNMGLGLKDTTVQRQAIEGMLASGGAPAEELPKYEFFAGDFAMKAKDYDASIAHFQKAAELNYPGSTPHLMLAEAYFQKAAAQATPNGQLPPAAKPIAAQGLPHLKKAIEIEKAAGTAVPAGWYNRGFTMAYTSGSPDAPQWALYQVDGDPSGKNWRQLLRTFQDRNRSMTSGENLDVLRLMSQTGALESEYDYSEYADTASKLALFGEVKSVIDQGRSSGKLSAGKLSDFYTQATAKIASDKASLPSAAAEGAKAANGRTAAFTAAAYHGYGDYAKAAELYKLALQKGSVDAGEVNTRLGIALAMSGDMAGAKSAFEQVTTGTRKEIAQFWLLWLSKKSAA